MADRRHEELMARIANAQVHAGEQVVLKHVREIEGRPEPDTPKTYNDGIDAAAWWFEQHHSSDRGFCCSCRTDTEGRYGDHADDCFVGQDLAAIRALKEQDDGT